MTRLRLRFLKVGKVRFLGSRDTARLWERLLRLACVPVVMSEGFTPRARLHFGLALGVAQESVSEYVDIDVALEPHEVDLVSVVGRIDEAMPEGMSITDAVMIDRSELSLQAVVTCCSWRFGAMGVTEDDLTRRVADALAADSIVIERRRKGRDVEDDVRPTIEHLSVCDTSTASEPILLADLITKPRSLRPLELLRALGIEAPAAHVCRLEQWTGPVDARLTPLEVASARTSASVESDELRVTSPPSGDQSRRDHPHERPNAAGEPSGDHVRIELAELEIG